MTTNDENNKAPENQEAASAETADKGAENPDRPRKVVRSASTRARPVFSDAPDAEPGAGTGGSGGAGATDASGEAGGGGAAGGEGKSAARPAGAPGVKAHDLRRPVGSRPAGARPGGGPGARPGGGGGPGGPGGPRPGGGARYERPRPPGVPRGSVMPGERPSGPGRRPPGGPRPDASPANPGEEGARPVGAGDVGGERPMRARPAGAPGGADRGPRPGGGDRGPRPEGAGRGPRPEGASRGPRPGGPDRGPRPDGAGRGPRPGGQAPQRSDGKAPPTGASKPAPTGKPAAPAASSQAKPTAAPKPAPRHAALPIHIPLAKAGTQAKKSAKPAPTAKEALSAKIAKAAQNAAAKVKGDSGAREADGKPAAETAEAPKAAETAPFEGDALSATWESAKDTLRAVGERAQGLIDAWLGGSNAAAIASIAESEEVPGAIRKVARRALNVLKARGVAVPTQSHVVRFIDDRAAVVEATLTPPDSTGTSSITITSRDSSGRYHIAEVIVREPFGILHAGSAWLSGSQIKEGRARAFENLGVAPVSVPVEWARHRIAEARKQNATSKQVLPLGLERCRELIEPVPEAEPKHPMADLEAEVTSELAWSRAPGSANLHEEPEFRSWIPDRKALEELLQGLGKRLGPEGARDQARVNAALEEEILLATDRFFSPEVRTVVAARMRDSAISIKARKGDARASEVLAVARAVREAGLITSPPREIPFLMGFFQKGLGAMAQQGGGSLRIPVDQSAGQPADTSEGGGEQQEPATEQTSGTPG